MSLADDDNAQVGRQVTPGPDAEQKAETEKPETDDDILKEGRDRYKAAQTYDSDNTANALDDLLFLSGGTNQWDQKSVQLRTAEGRPILTVNNLPTFLHQVTNEQRLNKLGGKVRPVDDNADEDTAEVIQGMIRHIEYDSNAAVATMTAVNSAAAIGFGWFRLVTEYESDTSFDQKIMFKRIRNALSVKKDPLSQELDGSDAKFYFIDSLEARAEFEKQYPDAAANNSNLVGQDMYRGWFTEDTVLVCEYYRVKELPATLCELQDGSKGWKDELPKEMHPLIKRERKSSRKTVEWFKMTGADILERTEIKCPWIPVFPVYGDEIDIDGKVVRSGIIRNSKDSFKAYNFWITCATEEVALRPKTPYIMAEGQDEGYENMWQSANTRSYSALYYRPKTVDGLLVPPPQRQAMADIPAGMLAMAMHAADNKKATTGLFDSSLGASGTASSGIQEREQQQQGDVANYHYADNCKITYKHALRCIVAMIPHYYDAARAVRILGEDETSEVVQVNQPFEQTNPKTKAVETVMHDLTVGTYDVTVSAGPSYSTQRQEAAEFMTDALQAVKDPASALVLTMLALKNQDVPGADEAVKLLKKLPPLNAIVEPEEGEDQEPMVMTPQGPLPASKAAQLLEQMSMALQNASAEVDKLQADKIANQQRELDIKQQDADTKRGEADTARKAAEAKAATDAEKVQAELLEAEAKRLQAEADNMRARAEATAAEVAASNTKAPQLEEIAALLAASKPQVPNRMAIKAPSGQVYEVAVGG